MKIVSFRVGKEETWGVITDKGLLDINKASSQLGSRVARFQSVNALIKAGLGSLEEVYTLIDASMRDGEHGWFLCDSQVEWLPPVPLPESIRDFGLFEKHILEMIRRIALGKLAPFDRWIERKSGGYSIAKKLNKGWYQQPAYYKGNRFSVVGHNASIVMPKTCNNFDFELEFGVFLCNQAANIKAEKASNHIFGMTLLNDFSARDIQFSEMRARMGPAKGKDFDSGYAMGPYLLTMDEVDDVNNMDFGVNLNGEHFGGGNSKEMHWTFEEVIAYTSRDETLYPGELLGSGTISGSKGSGCGAEVGKSLSPGDIVELTSPALGCLTNQVL